METVLGFLQACNNIVWGPPLLILLVGTHIYLTVKLRFPQRHIWTGVKLSVTPEKDAPGDVSQFGALSTALAATIGTGNIIGVGTAVALGGPGAVLWCWLTGVFGIATKYGEGLLAVKYRVQTSDGTMLGGPMYALERGLNAKWLAILFCIFGSIAAFGIGNLTQANAISGMLTKQFNISPYISGIVMVILTAVVIIGGVRSIARVTTKLVPLMAIFYVLGCLAILILNFEYLGATISLICKSAFSAKAAGGGFIGTTIMMAARYGIARGLFSNESGLGSAPIAAASATTKNPVRQALVSATGTFWDTVIICLMTGLVLVSSIIRHPSGYEGLAGNALTYQAFDQIPIIGALVLVVGLATFAFSTILGWAYYGERCIEYLFGKVSLKPYRIIFSIVTFIGATTVLDIAWEFSDLANAMMAIPNLLSLILLSGVIVSETRKYLWEDNLDLPSNEQIPKI